MRTAPGEPALKGRLASALGLDRNTLRRASDRAEAWIRAGLLVIFVVAGPMAAVAAGQWTAHTAGVQAAGGPRPGRFAGDAGLAAVLALVAVAFVLLAAMRLIRWVLNRRRLAAWEQAWQAIGPRWTGHRS
jgi:hypothetical protein